MNENPNITHPNCSTLVLRLALNATARACAKERGLPRRALVSSQDKSCSVALLGLAFTMAEILLSLTIIGVVAAITLPSLMANINERTWNTQRKALYARMSQAIAMMPQLGGYGAYSKESAEGAGDAVDTATETFLTEGLSKVLKINNICDSEHLADCGIPAQVTPIRGSLVSDLSAMSKLSDLHSLFNTSEGMYSYRGPDPKTAAFETANGESVLTFYNPNCSLDAGDAFISNTYSKSQPMMCANFVYDLNGTKGPNTVGKDVGVITALYSVQPIVVAPMLITEYPGTSNFIDAIGACKGVDVDSRLPNIYEATSLVHNMKLFFGVAQGDGGVWSSTARDSERAFYVGTASMRWQIAAKDGTNVGVHCIKR